MPMLRTLFVTLFVGLGCLAIPPPAHACSCIYQGPACQAYWKTDAVFDGTVTRIEKIEREEVSGDRVFTFHDLRVTLEVHQAWKGLSTRTVQVTTSAGGSSCGYQFEEGVRYLVFAYQWPGGGGLLSASSCSLTQRYDAARASVDFLESLAKPAAGGRVFGSVTTGARQFVHDRPYERQQTETDVTLVAGGERRTIRSSGGRYEFTGLEPGNYRVEITVPEGYTTWSTSRDPEIRNIRACAEENFSFAPNGRIAGRVVDADGRGLKDVQVEIASADAEPHPTYGLATVSARSDETGYFQVEQLPPGRYVAGVNLRDLPSKYNPYARSVYPGGSATEPEVIAVDLGQAIDLGVWFLPPPVPVARVHGLVTREDGTPVSGVYVHAWDRTGRATEQGRGVTGATSGPDGRFELELRQGRLYTFTARAEKSLLRIRSPRLDTGKSPESVIKIVLVEQR
jgi:hypothetical protein